MTNEQFKNITDKLKDYKIEFDSISFDPDGETVLNYCVHDVLATEALFKKVNIGIKKVIFNPPATIVFWHDGSKTVVKCGEDDIYDPEKGLAMAISKRALGNNGNYYNVFRKHLKSYEETEGDADWFRRFLSSIQSNFLMMKSCPTNDKEVPDANE